MVIPSLKNNIIVGIFGSAIGLKGELKVNYLTTTFEVFKSLKNYTDDTGSHQWKFKKIIFRNNKCVVHPYNCNSREEAKQFLGKKIFTDKKNLPPIEANQYYVYDLIDCKIYFTNTSDIGQVIDVTNFGAGDLLEVLYKNKKFYVPLDSNNIDSINISSKEIFADPIKGIID